MPRIPEPEIERLKNEVSVERLVEASGIELKKSGKDWLGRCPFHEDDSASLVVTSPTSAPRVRSTRAGSSWAGCRPATRARRPERQSLGRRSLAMRCKPPESPCTA
jgi:hypothetical protein